MIAKIKKIKHWLSLKLWQLQYSLTFCRRTGWKIKEAWGYADSTMDNFDYDLEDLGCPIYMVDEDLSNWSD